MRPSQYPTSFAMRDSLSFVPWRQMPGPQKAKTAAACRDAPAFGARRGGRSRAPFPTVSTRDANASRKASADAHALMDASMDDRARAKHARARPANTPLAVSRTALRARTRGPPRRAMRGERKLSPRPPPPTSSPITRSEAATVGGPGKCRRAPPRRRPALVRRPDRAEDPGGLGASEAPGPMLGVRVTGAGRTQSHSGPGMKRRALAELVVPPASGRPAARSIDPGVRPARGPQARSWSRCTRPSAARTATSPPPSTAGAAPPPRTILSLSLLSSPPPTDSCSALLARPPALLSLSLSLSLSLALSLALSLSHLSHLSLSLSLSLTLSILSLR